MCNLNLEAPSHDSQLLPVHCCSFLNDREVQLRLEGMARTVGVLGRLLSGLASLSPGHPSTDRLGAQVWFGVQQLLPTKDEAFSFNKKGSRDKKAAWQGTQK